MKDAHSKMDTTSPMYVYVRYMQLWKQLQEVTSLTLAHDDLLSHKRQKWIWAPYKVCILARFRGVTLDAVWIGEWICWSLVYTPLGTTSNYSATANLQNSQITTAPAKPFPSLLCLQQPFPSNGFEQWSFFSFPHSGLLVNCQPSTNWFPGWRPFHTNLPNFS
jgi:hypothetical protein